MSSAELHISPQTTLIPSINAWEIYLADQGKSVHTLKAFIGDIKLLSKYLPSDIKIGDITINDLNQFLDWMQNKRSIPCSPKSYARRITSLKSFFRWLFNGGRIVINPAEKVIQHSVISPLPEVLTRKEQNSILKAAEKHRHLKHPDSRFYVLYSFLINTGVKKGECLSLSLNHIDLESPTGAIAFIRYSSATNRYKERKIELPLEWVEAYHEYLSQYQPMEKVFPWSPRRLEYLLEDLGKEAGLTKHLSFDMCRWSCALNDFTSGMELEHVRQKLGISKIQWHEIYIKLKKLSEK
jgi:integrase/recombinase XerD